MREGGRWRFFIHFGFVKKGNGRKDHTFISFHDTTWEKGGVKKSDVDIHSVKEKKGGEKGGHVLFTNTGEPKVGRRKRDLLPSISQ